MNRHIARDRGGGGGGSTTTGQASRVVIALLNSRLTYAECLQFTRGIEQITRGESETRRVHITPEDGEEGGGVGE